MGHDLGHFFGGDHLDGVPGADEQIVGVGLFLRNLNAYFAADASLKIDLAPLFDPFENAAIQFEKINAVDGADLQTSLAASAVVSVDHREFFGELFAGAFLGHRILTTVDSGLDGRDSLRQAFLA